MTGRVTEYANIEGELVALFERLHAEVSPDVVCLSVKRTVPDGVLVSLDPLNPASASAWAHAENGLALVDFGFGVYGPTWQLPIEGANPGASKEELLQEVEELCRAVMAGNCQNKRGFLSISGSIQVGDRPYKITNLLKFRPKPPLHGTRFYQPYVSH